MPDVVIAAHTRERIVSIVFDFRPVLAELVHGVWSHRAAQAIRKRSYVYDSLGRPRFRDRGHYLNTTPAIKPPTKEGTGCAQLQVADLSALRLYVGAMSPPRVL